MCRLHVTLQRTFGGNCWDDVKRRTEMSLDYRSGGHGGSTSRLRHIPEDNSPSAIASSYGSTVLTHHVSPAVVSAETAESNSQPSRDANICSAFPTPPDSQASSQDSSQSSDPQSTKFNTNSNNVLSHPPPLIPHVESQEPPSLETTSRLCHAGPPHLIPIALKTEPDALWHATLQTSPWPVPPNAPSSGESGEPVSKTTGLPDSKCIII